MTPSALLLALAISQVDPAPAPPAPDAASPPAAETAVKAEPAPAPAPAASSPAAAPAESSPAAAPAAAAASAPSGEPAPTPQAVAAPAAAAATLPPTEPAAEVPAGTPPASALPPEAAALAAPAAAYSAAEAAPVGGCPAVPQCECAKEDPPTHWGMTIDGGFPDAAAIGIVWRPWNWLRLEAAGTSTVYASNGYRAGLTLVPFHFPIAPTLTVNYGRALEADWNPMLEKFGSPNADLAPVLSRLGYQYVNAHVGLELGAPRRFVFFLRAGLTQIWTELHNLTPAAAAQISNGTVTIADSSLTVRVASAKVGFLIYFF